MIDVHSLKPGDRLIYGRGISGAKYRIVVKKVHTSDIISDWTEITHGKETRFHPNLNHNKNDFAVFPLTYAGPKKSFGDFL